MKFMWLTEMRWIVTRGTLAVVGFSGEIFEKKKKERINCLLSKKLKHVQNQEANGELS